MRKKMIRRMVNGLASVCAVSLVCPVTHAFAADDPPEQPVEGALRKTDQNTLAASQSPMAQGQAPSLPDYFKFGAFELRPYIQGGFLYDDNIRITSENRLEDEVWTLTPGVVLGAGQYRQAVGTFLALDYHPDLIFYTHNSKYNSVDHNASLLAQKRWEKLALSVGQGYVDGSGGYTEALNRVERAIYDTTLKGTYLFSDKTSFELIGRQTIADYDESEDAADDLYSYNIWEVQPWANYQWTPKVKVGLGAIFGWRDVRSNPNQTYQQPLVRAVYTWSDKTRIYGHAGVEFEQYQGGGDHGPTFVFSLAGDYRPWEYTTFTLEGYRRNQNSIVFEGQNYTSTGVRVTARQQIGQRLFVSLTGGYEQSDYYSLPGYSSIDRTDDYFYVGPTIDYSLTERWYVGAFYQYRDNASTLDGYDFYNNQVGLRASYRF